MKTKKLCYYDLCLNWNDWLKKYIWGKKVSLMNQESMNMHIYSALLKEIKEKHVKAIKNALAFIIWFIFIWRS